MIISLRDFGEIPARFCQQVVISEFAKDFPKIPIVTINAVCLMPAFPVKCIISATEILAFVSLLSCLSCQPNKTATEPTLIINADSLANEGFKAFQEDPSKAIPLLRSAAVGYAADSNLIKSGMMFLNVANIYEEYVPNKDSAVYYAKRSMDIYEKENDSMQMANLYKYYGYLIGINGHPAEGETYIQKAITIYQGKGSKEGIAVSHFNLARVYIVKGEYNKADSLLDLAEPVWIEVNDTSRLKLIEAEKAKIADYLNK